MTSAAAAGVVSEDGAHDARQSPYQGLVPFTEEDQPWFFGRTREKRILVANLRARRLTIAYGPSGVGKTSLLRAGVKTEITSETDDEHRPVVVVFDSWSVSDPLIALKRQLASLASLDGEDSRPVQSVGEQISCSDLAARVGEELDCQLLLILDQFEEYFRYTPNPVAAGTFGAELPALLASSNERTNILLSIRDDRLARLDVLKTRIPALLDNLIRISRLDREGATEAIIRPIERFNKDAGTHVEIEPELVETVLQQVAQGGIHLGEVGSGGRVEESAIEAPFLQLVMSRLWDSARSRGLAVLRRSLLDEMGGANEIVQSHLDVTLDELVPSDKTVTARMFDRMVTPSGTKIAHQLGDLTAWGGVHVDRTIEVLEKLDAARLVRTVEFHPDQPMATRFELYHDVLAAAALGWTARQMRIDGELAAKDRRAQKWGWLSFLLYPIPIGFWFSVRALRAKPRDRPTRNKAMIGLGASIMALLLWGLLIFDTVNAPQTKSVFDLTVGECLESPTEDVVTDVTIVGCEDPHDLEVISVRSLGGGPDTEYPGGAEVVDRAFTLCLEDFETYVGLPYQESDLVLDPYYPLETSWVLAGDRDVACVVGGSGGEQLTGSMLGTGR